MRLDDIRAVLGPVDETLIAQISRTDATVEELAEAWGWLNADEAMISEGRPLPRGRVAELVAILEAAEPDPEE
ncbi:hypothetical protein ACDP63_16115 [Paracoccus sp. P2]|uniref:Uncharacterized protein n=1 Tax=Paracoccus pantotrophus TaxID=82367 RepID=A0A7H9BRV2_PARPN|nr:hypothetical protein [Paracoccus pantotrophus]MDF3856377.1 hypothetical protein [Paracoccus pantotrophus]QLH14090.1 hypothetical protein HYQ43_07535 [Paracoccus pantotrophus]RDD93092.1 hypothetical protein DTW92_19770 [Paracoccus pantotrophus]RNI17314.1 hypothetical protein EB844_09160 [Paracoccus pantotrophus]WGR67594.1 hypothetical protein E3U24_20535 [Paracoccus pantotrophus]